MVPSPATRPKKRRKKVTWWESSNYMGMDQNVYIPVYVYILFNEYTYIYIYIYLQYHEGNGHPSRFLALERDKTRLLTQESLHHWQFCD